MAKPRQPSATWHAAEIKMNRPINSRPHIRLFHPFFVGTGGALLIAAAFTDAMYVSNAMIQWVNFSAWLIAGGLAMAPIAVVVLVIDALLGRAGRLRLPDLGLLASAAILSMVNVLVHTRDAWTAVMPDGIVLSVIVAVLLFMAGLRGWSVTDARIDQQVDRA